MKLLIRNGRVVYPVTGTVSLLDLLLEDGKIVLMERGLPAQADEILDAAGLVVSPAPSRNTLTSRASAIWLNISPS